jgi:hypothetical protein
VRGVLKKLKQKLKQNLELAEKQLHLKTLFWIAITGILKIALRIYVYVTLICNKFISFGRFCGWISLAGQIVQSKAGSPISLYGGWSSLGLNVFNKEVPKISFIP